MKCYTIEVITADNSRHFEVVSADDELSALDIVTEYYTTELDEEIIDIKVV